jgi:transcriptional repressor of dcmA and dcmR
MVERNDELLDIGQAAEFLGVSETSLRRWTNAGRLACLRVGGRRERRFRRADLLTFMEEQPAAGLGGDGHLGAPLARRPAVDRSVVTPGNHVCGLYRSDRGRATLATSFLADGLQPGSVCFLSGQPNVHEEVLAQLKVERPSLGQDIDTGRLVLSAHHSSPDAQNDYWQTQFAAALRGGARSLRLVGDMGSFYHDSGARALLDYDAGYDRVIARRYPVATLCVYDVRVFSALEVLDALEVHRDILRYPAEQLLA